MGGVRGRTHQYCGRRERGNDPRVQDEPGSGERPPSIEATERTRRVSRLAPTGATDGSTTRPAMVKVSFSIPVLYARLEPALW